METYRQPQQPAQLLGLPTQAYYQLIHTLAGILPPPVNDTPEALLARTQSAIDEVAGMLPTNANEARLAAQCVAARAQADDVLRLLRKHAGDIALEVKLNAQYVAMLRASQGAHGHLLRAQAVRHKREKSDAALKADEWTQHVVTSELQRALAAGPVPATPAAAQPAPAPAAAPPTPAAEPVPVAPPPPVLAEASPPPPPAAAPPLPPVSAPVAAWPAAPAAPEQTPGPRRARGMAAPAEADEPPRDLAAETDYYAVTYPHRAREIRHHGGLPPHCSFGPPDDDLLRAIATSTSPILRALDGMSAAAE